MKRAVKILFPDITHGGKIYNKGEIEENPSDWLIKCAKEKITQYHSDSFKQVRICRFVNKFEDEEDFEDEVKDEIVRSPIIKSGGYDDDLHDKSRSELLIIATSLGLKKQIVNSIKDNDKIRSIITTLRII